MFYIFPKYSYCMRILLLLSLTVLLAACTPTPEQKIDSFQECIDAGYPAMESYPRQCSNGENTWVEEIKNYISKDVSFCMAAKFGCEEGERPFSDETGCGCEPRKPCTREYMPVCGEVEVQCITAPCDPVKTTFSNKCEAENAGAKSIVEGACVEEVNPEGACLSFDGNWLEESQECEGMAESQCAASGGTFNECASACRNNPEAEMCTMQCVVVCDFS
jgi:hypothetical protein